MYDKRAGAIEQMFENSLAECQIDQQADSHAKTCRACLFSVQQDKSNHNPDKTGVVQLGQHRKNDIRKSAPQVFLYFQ